MTKECTSAGSFVRQLGVSESDKRQNRKQVHYLVTFLEHTAKTDIILILHRLNSKLIEITSEVKG